MYGRKQSHPVLFRFGCPWVPQLGVAQNCPVKAPVHVHPPVPSGVPPFRHVKSSQKESMNWFGCTVSPEQSQTTDWPTMLDGCPWHTEKQMPSLCWYWMLLVQMHVRTPVVVLSWHVGHVLMQHP